MKNSNPMRMPKTSAKPVPRVSQPARPPIRPKAAPQTIPLKIPPIGAKRIPAKTALIRDRRIPWFGLKSCPAGNILLDQPLLSRREDAGECYDHPDNDSVDEAVT